MIVLSLLSLLNLQIIAVINKLFLIVSVKLNLSAKDTEDSDEDITKLFKKFPFKEMKQKIDKSLFKVPLKEELKQGIRTKKITSAKHIDSRDFAKEFDNKIEVANKIKSKEIQYWRASSDINSFYLCIGYAYLELITKKGLSYIKDLENMYYHL